MQAPDGSTPGARSALFVMAADLQLHPVVVVRALKYASDNFLYFSSASQAFYVGIIQQGSSVEASVLEVALQRLRADFGGEYFVKEKRTKTIDTCSNSRCTCCSACVFGTMVRFVCCSRVRTTFVNGRVILLSLMHRLGLPLLRASSTSMLVMQVRYVGIVQLCFYRRLMGGIIEAISVLSSRARPVRYRIRYLQKNLVQKSWAVESTRVLVVRLDIVSVIRSSTNTCADMAPQLYLSPKELHVLHFDYMCMQALEGHQGDTQQWLLVRDSRLCR